MEVLTINGMDSGTSAHKKLPTMLSKRVHIVMTNECCTTKGYPTRIDNALSMKCPKGN